MVCVGACGAGCGAGCGGDLRKESVLSALVTADAAFAHTHKQRTVGARCTHGRDFCWVATFRCRRYSSVRTFMKPSSWDRVRVRDGDRDGDGMRMGTG